jgi:hypothetical protein
MSQNYQRETLPVFMEGKKIGNAIMSNSGLLTMTLNSDIVARNFEVGSIEHLSIERKIKD